MYAVTGGPRLVGEPPVSRGHASVDQAVDGGPVGEAKIMSRHAPTPPQLMVQESSLLIEWDIDRFFPESEEPDRIILIFSAGDSTVERFLDSSERSVELSAELLRPLAGMILTIIIGFQWGQDPPLMTAGAIYLPKVDEGGPLWEEPRPMFTTACPGRKISRSSASDGHTFYSDGTETPTTRCSCDSVRRAHRRRSTTSSSWREAPRARCAARSRRTNGMPSRSRAATKGCSGSTIPSGPTSSGKRRKSS